MKKQLIPQLADAFCSPYLQSKLLIPILERERGRKFALSFYYGEFRGDIKDILRSREQFIIVPNDHKKIRDYMITRNSWLHSIPWKWSLRCEAISNCWRKIQAYRGLHCTFSRSLYDQAIINLLEKLISSTWFLLHCVHSTLHLLYMWVQTHLGLSRSIWLILRHLSYFRFTKTQLGTIRI